MNKFLLHKICKAANIKASSLINAIFICIVISVFCGCLVLISHYQNVLNNQLFAQENLINRNNSSFIYLLNNAESIPYNQTEIIDVFEDGFSSSIQKKHWGFYDVLVCKTNFRNDTILKTALVGQKSNSNNNLALYVTDYDKPLKLSGNTKIFGNIKVPNARTEQAYINGQKGNSIKLKGKQLKSDDKLPRIEKKIIVDISKYEPISLNTFDKRPVIINTFNETTKVIDLTETVELRDIVCKGNIVLTSKNVIHVSNTAVLRDVIISAPFVRIMRGFKGNVQIVAKDSVNIDESVQLLYPSSIYVKNNDSASVIISDNSTIAGGIVIDGDTFSGTLNRSLTIQEKATVIGNTYCYGSTQLKGEVVGSIYTDKFFLKTESSTYENVILNGSINRDSLPENFVELPLLKNNFNERNYAVVKEF